MSRKIPDPIAREVRKRCGFGCVICGLPLYEYDHLKGWANVKEHIAEDITLLCDKHHAEVTKGLLPREDVRNADNNPRNKRAGECKPLELHFGGKNCDIFLGNNYFTTSYISDDSVLFPIIINGKPLIKFSFQDGELLLNLCLFNEVDQEILTIIDSHLLYSLTAWDIEFKGKVLTIRTGSRKILLKIEFRAPNRIYIRNGKFTYQGRTVNIKRNHLEIDGNRLSNNQAIGVQAGIIIGEHPRNLKGFFHTS